jgi:anti-sigma factor RsiW
MLTTTTTTTTTSMISSTHPGQQTRSIHDRRDAALAQFTAHRNDIQRLIDRYRDRGVDPVEVPGLRRMIQACRQARLILSVIDLERAAA